MNSGPKKSTLHDVMKISKALLCLLLLPLSSCTDSDDLPASEEVLLTRERAAAWFSEDRLEDARRELAPLVASKSALAEDLLRAARIEFAANQAEAAASFLDRAESKGTQDPTLPFLRGQLARESGEIERAVKELERAHELTPSCLATHLALGAAYDDLDMGAEAESCYQAVVDAGIENAGSWYVSAIYRLGRLLIEDGRVTEGQRYTAMRQTLESEGIAAPVESILRLGNLGRLLAPPPTGATAPAFEAVLSWKAHKLPAFTPAQITRLRARDLNADGAPDLIIQTSEGVISAKNDEETGWSATTAWSGSADFSLELDYDNDEDLDLFVCAAPQAGAW